MYVVGTQKNRLKHSKHMFKLTSKIIITILCSIITTYETACQKTNLQVLSIIALDHVERVKYCDVLSQIKAKLNHCLRPNQHISYHAHISTCTLAVFTLSTLWDVFLISTQYSMYKFSVILFVIWILSFIVLMKKCGS